MRRTQTRITGVWAPHHGHNSTLIRPTSSETGLLAVEFVLWLWWEVCGMATTIAAAVAERLSFVLSATATPNCTDTRRYNQSTTGSSYLICVFGSVDQLTAATFSADDVLVKSRLCPPANTFDCSTEGFNDVRCSHCYFSSCLGCDKLMSTNTTTMVIHRTSSDGGE